MIFITFSFFLFSVILFLAALYQIMILLRPGIYPPRHMVRQKAAVLSVGGVISLLLAFLFLLFT